MRAVRAVGLVAAREAGNRLRSRAFVLGTAITFLAAVGVVRYGADR